MMARILMSFLAVTSFYCLFGVSSAQACTPYNDPNWKEAAQKRRLSSMAKADVVLIGRFVRTLTDKAEHKVVYPQRVLRGPMKRAYLIPAPISTCGPYPPQNTLLKLYLSGAGNSFGVVAYEKIK